MKITKIETIVVNMPMVIAGNVTPKQGGVARTSMDTLLVRIDTDEGITGWGEGFGHRIFTATRAALDSFIGPMCIGQDPTEIVEHDTQGDWRRSLLKNKWDRRKNNEGKRRWQRLRHLLRTRWDDPAGGATATRNATSVCLAYNSNARSDGLLVSRLSLRRDSVMGD